jgi:hypothetical protein
MQRGWKVMVVKDTLLGPPHIISPTKGCKYGVRLIESASAWYGIRIVYNINYHIPCPKWIVHKQGCILLQTLSLEKWPQSLSSKNH